MQKPDYLAFISYRHADNREPDRCWATWLHRALETYVIPPDLVGTTDLRGGKVPAKIYPIFRDEEEFSAEASLAPAIRDALLRSKILIVLCSPKSVQSPYVAEEIRHFKSLGRSAHIIPVLLDGEPGHPEREAFPEPLRLQFESDGSISQETVEPLAADFRLPDATEGYTSPAAYERRLRAEKLPSAERATLAAAYRERSQLAFLKIVSAVLAVPLATLTRRDQAHQLSLARKRARIFRGVAAALTLLLTLSIVTGLYANRKRKEAVKARDSANDLVGFMLTDLHDQLSQTGRLDVLSTTVAKVDSHLADNPVPPRLVADLRLQQARILFGQGRLEEAVRRAQSTLAQLPGDAPMRSGRAKLHAFLGDVLAWESTHTPEAEAECLKALGLFDSTTTDPAAIEALVRTHIALGDIRRDEGRITEALASYQSAWELAATAAPALDTIAALAFQRKAEVCLLNNEPARAAESVKQVLDLTEKHLTVTPNSHPWLVVKAETLNLRSTMERHSGHIGTSLSTLREAETCAEQTATPGQLHRQFLLSSIRGQIAAHPSPTLTLPQRGELFTSALHTQRSLCREDPSNRSWTGKLASTLRDRAGFHMNLAELFKDPSFRGKALADLREASTLLEPVNIPGTLRERAETALSLAAVDETSARPSHLATARDLLSRMPAEDVDSLVLSAMLDLSASPPATAESHAKILAAWNKATGIRKSAISPQLAESHMRLAASSADEATFTTQSSHALTILRAAKISGGDQPDLDEKIALTLSSIARSLQKLNLPERSAAAYRESAAILGELVARYPSHPSSFREISLAEYQLGKIATAQGDASSALGLLHSSLDNYRTFIQTASLETPRPPSPLSLANLTAIRAIVSREAEAAALLSRHEAAADAWGFLFSACSKVDASSLSEEDKKSFSDIHQQSLAGAIDAFSQLSHLSADQAATARTLISAAKPSEIPPDRLSELKSRLEAKPTNR